MCREFVKTVENTPIVAAIKNKEGLEVCLKTDIDVIFVLYGDVCSIPHIVKKIKDAGKIAMVHIDLINGLSGKNVAVDYIKNNTQADGIITTKNNLIAHAKEVGLNTILRYFVLDSMALLTIENQAKQSNIQPDIIEIIPGVVVPKIIKCIDKISKVPVMAGGLISDKEDVMNALSSGAISISTTNQNVWFLD
ncbi:glycerol-3-phosphate responsive antiterminator [Lachnobacterium bovis]|uniref:Glycerol uptake operon antiterminator n=1 Tax=Lachnobacterium bovis TaxID=140626 RepID=A0A1H9RRL7_9FIRM|nr:glycerol-3-phosphate responsive antiterminator [Lachnobacterium bovis]SER74763.1 glycerol uptake operon antiterminator [Lachnobacterium bovis]